ncbi:MAG: glycosyltransferase [Chloroflexota bacterium]
MMPSTATVFPLPDGTVYSKRKDFTPFYGPTPDDYASIIGKERMERLLSVAERLKGLKLLEINATARGGGVAEMLYTAIPFLNELGIEAEWKIICGSEEFFECTKNLHNLLQGKRGNYTPEMAQVYFRTLEQCWAANLIDYDPDVIIIHDPQPLCLPRYLKRPDQTWIWRCHLDIEETLLAANPGLWDFLTPCAKDYSAAIFSASHYVVSRWPLPKFIVPPFIDPLSEKNRELSQKEIDSVLAKYHIDPAVPILAQVGRFDPWKGLERTVATYRSVRQEVNCQLVLAGGLAADDPEGEGILAALVTETKDDEGIHVLKLSLADRLENYREVNALQRAASVIMQPSTREGFGLVITEALWKDKPVIAAEVGAIPLQIREGDTGYFYNRAKRIARKVISLLGDKQAAESMGRRGKEYVSEHFLLPDRIADCLLTIDTLLNVAGNRKLPPDTIISYHPWYKLSKRR